MPITLAQLEDHVEHAIHGEADPRIAPVDLVNQAGEFFASMAHWRFLDRNPVNLTLVADQSWLALPSDFRSIQSATFGDNLARSFELVDLTRIIWLRGSAQITSTMFYAAVTWPGQTDVTSSPPAPRLELFPTPNADVTGNPVVIDYNAGWEPMSSATDVANVPNWIIPLLIEVVRQYTLGILDSDRGRGSVSTRMVPVLASDFLRRMQIRDGAAQANLGYMRGGATERSFYARNQYLHDSIDVSSS